MAITTRNYTPGSYEATGAIALTDVGPAAVFIELDDMGYKFALSDIHFYTAADMATEISPSSYTLTESIDYTVREAGADGSKKTVYIKYQITNETYQTGTIYISGNSFGTFLDNDILYNATSYQPTAGSIVQRDSNGGVIVNAIISPPESITATSAGVAASILTVGTHITTDGGSALDSVTLADGTVGQIKHFAVKAVGNGADSVDITPATMVGGSKITFAASPLGLGCVMEYTSTGWVVVANNGGTIS